MGTACGKISMAKASKAVATATKPPLPHKPKDRWMWRGTRTSDAIHVLSEATLSPGVSAVSSSTTCDLICSYSWQDSKKACVKIPGAHAL
jgi:hypothetical protein